ncbi:enoyl-CoA hydratase [Pseudonocardia sp. TRM90224]|uniref:enoyl-CoA hydratase n=1 Tax=Pseudonocardia sp. TRM90224 TaxID=2812678 RepID=UPI001E3E081B|nr:enoyl-CoA hydratase [Pseudonocardia sp. TRM90224]
MITVSVAERVGVIELARPERRNALDVAHCRDLAAAVEEVLAAGVGAVVVTGAGTSFCSGADLDEVYSDGFRDALRTALDALVAAPVPVMAAVNGPAIGAGTQLAIACDLRVVSPEAVFAVPTARIGLAVDPWTVERIAQLAGGATARALLLACDRIGADLALARGLADRIGHRDAALALAAEIAGFAPLTLRYSKMAADRTGHVVDPELLAAFEACWASADLVEGRTARTERRDPVFTGR